MYVSYSRMYYRNNSIILNKKIYTFCPLCEKMYEVEERKRAETIAYRIKMEDSMIDMNYSINSGKLGKQVLWAFIQVR